MALESDSPQLPIRRNSHPTASKTIELVRREIEALSLICHEVSFSLEDSAKEQQDGAGKGRALTIPKVSQFPSQIHLLLGVDEKHGRPDLCYQPSDIFSVEY